MDLHQVVLQILLLDVGWHGRVDQFWCHRGTFATMGVIAIIISYYICWVQLIWTHFFNAKNITSQELWTFEIEN
jgi:NhaP-type Na+/H+ or K+/H+ antiporter